MNEIVLMFIISFAVATVTNITASLNTSKKGKYSVISLMLTKEQGKR